MVASQIPIFDFSEQTLKLKGGSSEGWKSMCDKVIEACEEYGCFMVAYDRVPMPLYDDFFRALQSLFDLPEETKEKTTNSLYSTGYLGKDEDVPLFRSLGIDNAPQLDATKAFTDLMWPQGKPDVCQAIHSMAAKMHDLYKLLIRMICQGFRVEQNLASQLEANPTCFRVMKYDPPNSPDSALGLQVHADETILSILGENEVHGLKVLSKGGEWIKVQPSKGTFVVLVGDMLEVMTNGRFQASQHVVEIAGNRERYSYGLFTAPEGGTMVEAFNELIDKEHPLRYRPFYYEDYMQYYRYEGGYNNISVKVYAGI